LAVLKKQFFENINIGQTWTQVGASAADSGVWRLRHRAMALLGCRPRLCLRRSHRSPANQDL